MLFYAFIAEFIYFISTSCTTHSTYLYCRGLVQSTSLFFMLGDWITWEGQKDHRPDGRTTWHSDFSADQLVGPQGSWTSSPTSWSNCLALISFRYSLSTDQLVGPLGSWTSSPTSWLDCSPLTSTRCSLRHRPVGWAARCSTLCQPAGRIVRRFIVSYVGARQLSWGLLGVRILHASFVS
jgi:hypothetical protein